MAVLARDDLKAPLVQSNYDELLQHPEEYYAAADILWVMMASALVFMMVPALSLIFAGLGNRPFAMTMFRLPMLTAAVIGFQWTLWGYALTFTRSIRLGTSWYGTESRALGLKDIVARPVIVGDDDSNINEAFFTATVPELVYVLFEGMFASFTAAVVCGGTMQRVRPARFLIFISIWLVLVYAPVARWSWDADGWSRSLGTMDFAGGTPVHIVSGTTVAAFAVFYAIERKRNFGRAAVEGWRCFQERFILIIRKTLRWLLVVRGPARTTEIQADDMPAEPYNLNYMVLGTALLWFGWAGFNGGSALGANLRAASAWLSTHVAACAGGTTGLIWIWLSKLKAWFYALVANWPGMSAATVGANGVPTGRSSRNDLHDLERDQARAQERERARQLAAQRFERLSVIYFCDGAIAGLVAITPGAGYVPVWSATVFGVVAAIGVNILKNETDVYLKHDELQVFAVHTGAGVIGMLLTGLLADQTTIGLDGHSQMPNPDYSKGQRFALQLADSAAGIGYTFVMTLAILYFMKALVFLVRLPADPVAWWDAAGYSLSDGNRMLEDDFQAVEMQRWRDREIAQAPPAAAVPVAYPANAAATRAGQGQGAQSAPEEAPRDAAP